MSIFVLFTMQRQIIGKKLTMTDKREDGVLEIQPRATGCEMQTEQWRQLSWGESERMKLSWATFWIVRKSFLSNFSIKIHEKVYFLCTGQRDNADEEGRKTSSKNYESHLNSFEVKKYLYLNWTSLIANQAVVGT